MKRLARFDARHSPLAMAPGAPARGGLPWTREACLRRLGLDPDASHSPEAVSAAYRRCLFKFHPDSGGAGASAAALNEIVHAHSRLLRLSSSGESRRGARPGGYGNQWGGYDRGAGANHAEHRDPMGLWRWRTSGARRFAGNVRFGIVLAGLTTAATLQYARSTAERRKAERSPRLRALMNLRPEN